MRAEDCRTGIYHTVDGEEREIRVELLDEAMVEVYRGWTPERRIAAGLSAYAFVRERVRAQIACQHPDWSEEEVRSAVVRRLRGEP